MEFIHVSKAKEMSEKLITMISPYAIFKITAISENQEYGVNFNLTKEESLTAASYLINEGFAIWRNDFDEKYGYVIQLTDRGRRLKEFGSLAVFNRDEFDSKSRKERQDRRLDALYLINFWIAIAAVGGLVYNFVQILDFYDKHDLNEKMLPFFLTGAVVGLIAGIISMLIWNNKRRARYLP